jgi:hypothetical protein
VTRWDVAAIPFWAALGLASLWVAMQRGHEYAVLLALSGIPALALALATMAAWRRGGRPPLPGHTTTTQNAIAFAFALVWLLVGAVIGIVTESGGPTAILYNANGLLIGMLIASRARGEERVSMAIARGLGRDPAPVRPPRLRAPAAHARSSED